MISTHVLDLGAGQPASGVSVALAVRRGSDWTPVATRLTDAAGRIASFGEGLSFTAGLYRLTFDTGAYYDARGGTTLFPEVQVTFALKDRDTHLHVPLLVSPFGYSTYKGT